VEVDAAAAPPASFRGRLSNAKADWLAAAAAALWAGERGMGSAILQSILEAPAEVGPLTRQFDIATTAAGLAAGQSVIEPAKPEPQVLRALMQRGAAPLAIVGDSHSRLYVRRARWKGRWLAPIHLATAGASARGLANAQSRSGQGDLVRRFVAGLARLVARPPILFVFGQVDVEFVFTFKRLENDPPSTFDLADFETFCVETADRYADFVAGLGLAPRQGILAGVFPPALSDAAWRAGYLNAYIAQTESNLALDVLRARLERADIPSLHARTAQHRLFNRHLAAAPPRRGLGYIDVFDDLLSDAGVVDVRFLGPAAGLDHHLDAAATRPMVVSVLQRLINDCEHVESLATSGAQDALV
jgi:hypothetical protein